MPREKRKYGGKRNKEAYIELEYAHSRIIYKGQNNKVLYHNRLEY
jgi:hypothetical protein